MKTEQFYKNLQVPAGRRVDAILDTDAYNEVDDQFAIAYMLLKKERINTIGICAAPFLNRRSKSAEDGMEKSYAEILKLLSLMEMDSFAQNVYKGSTSFMESEKEPVMSAAAEYMASEAKKYSPENPLYIIAIGAITNVASAILLAPEAMRENTVIVWLGGHSREWHDTMEFNMKQDYKAARVVFNCGAPVVQLPCNGVVSEFRTTKAELEFWLKGKNPIANYLAENAINEAESYGKGTAWSRCIWDVTAVAWLLNDGEKFMRSYLLDSPIPQDNHLYCYDRKRHDICYVYSVKRDPLFTDLFKTLIGE